MNGIDAVLFEPVGVLVDEQGQAYEDVAPALNELDALGVQMIAVTPLSAAAMARAVTEASLSPDRVICLTDTEQGIRAAREAGVQPVLMMNDPDEAMRLTALNPAGGIVSLQELPDFVRFVAAGDRLR